MVVYHSYLPALVTTVLRQATSMRSGALQPWDPPPSPQSFDFSDSWVWVVGLERWKFERRAHASPHSDPCQLRRRTVLFAPALSRTTRQYLARSSVGGGFCLETSVEELVTLLRRAAACVGDGARPRCADPAFCLTDRERLLLHSLCTEPNLRAVATRLFLAEGTVRNYASTLYRKLGVRGRNEALQWALRYAPGLLAVGASPDDAAP